VQRQQLKWFTYGGALMFLWLVLGDYLLPNLGILGALSGVIYALVPMATGVAILRYWLYDIDRLINRTLVYGLLTALLAGIYAGAVLVLGQVFGGVGRGPPSWAVAGATLAVAALFQPACRRIQQVVDRRFNRRKYKAAKTIERFSTRLRDQVDQDTPSAELVTVVDQTMQLPPRHCGSDQPRRPSQVIEGEKAKPPIRHDPCMPCRFGLLRSSRSGAVCPGAQSRRSDRDYPLRTAGDRCLWHVGGTADEDDDDPPVTATAPAVGR
jgi:hypothetical protein